MEQQTGAIAEFGGSKHRRFQRNAHIAESDAQGRACGGTVHKVTDKLCKINRGRNEFCETKFIAEFLQIDLQEFKTPECYKVGYAL